MKLNNFFENDIFVSGIKILFFAVTVTGLNFSQADASGFTSNYQQDIVPHEATLWNHLR